MSRSTPKLLHACLIVVASLSAMSATVRAQQEAAPIRFEPCGNATHVVECALFTVRERPGAPATRRLSLRVVRLRQHRTAQATSATFILAGGPGGSASAMALGDLTVYDAWAEHGDVVFMDQRGTEEGSPLRCPVGPDFDPFAGFFPAEGLSRCHAAATRIADLAAYGTEDAAQDIEAARIALGYREVNFMAISYGTRLAMEYIERYPDRVRAAVLDGVAPRELHVPLHYVADAEASLRRLAVVCRADEACRRFGDPFARFRSVMSRLAAKPAIAMVRMSPSSPEIRSTMGAEDLAYIVRAQLYGDSAPRLPYLLAHADSTGDLAQFAQMYVQRVVGVARTSSLGLHLSVFCAEDIATLTPGQIKSSTASTVAGQYLVNQYVASCKRWKVPPGQTSRVTPRITRPLLMLSGALDPVSPPNWADTVGTRSTRVRHVVFPYGGHASPGAGMTSCKNRLIGEFLRTARPESLDVGCIAGALAPRFSTQQ